MPVKKSINGIRKTKPATQPVAEKPVQKQVKKEVLPKQEENKEVDLKQTKELDSTTEAEIEEVEDVEEEEVIQEESNEVEAVEETIDDEPAFEEKKGSNKRMPLNVPYMTDNAIVNICMAVRGAIDGTNQLKTKAVVIGLDNRLRDKDVSAAIALKNFFISNHVPCIIHANPEEVEYRSRIVDAEKEVTLDIPKPYTYITVLVGVSKNEYLEDRQLIEDTYWNVNFCGDEDSAGNVATINYSDPNSCCSTSIIYPLLRDAVLNHKEQGFKITKTVATGFYASIQHSLLYARKIHASVLKVYHNLLIDGADYIKVEETINCLPEGSLTFVKLMLNKLTFVGGIATATITNKELEPFKGLPENKFHNIIRRSVRTFRYLENVKAWCIYVEEVPGEYYVVLQTKKSTPYDMYNIAKRNNGTGDKTDSICLIYSFDKEKVFKNLKDHIKDKDEKQSK